MTTPTDPRLTAEQIERLERLESAAFERGPFAQQRVADDLYLSALMAAFPALIAAAKRDAEASERRFPIQRGPSIPWSLIAPYDAQARENHGGQDLERLAKRGGLGPCEAVAVLESRPWRRMEPDAALARLRAIAGLPTLRPPRRRTRADASDRLRTEDPG